DGVELDAAVRRMRDALLLADVLVGRAVRLRRATEVDAAIRDDREARHLLLRLGVGDGAVVADEGRAPADLALRRIDGEGGDEPLVGRKARDRAEVNLVPSLAQEAGQDGEARDRHGDDAADQAAEAERRSL